MTENDKNKQYILQNHQNQEDQDDDQRFIPKNQENQEVQENQEENQEGQENKNNTGIRPESNQQRNLDREVGGLEDKEIKQQVIEEVKDVWDDHATSINENAQESDEELSDAASSTLRQSWIHRGKQTKKRDKKIQEAAAESFEEMSHAERVKEAREKQASNSKGERGL